MSIYAYIRLWDIVEPELFLVHMHVYVMQTAHRSQYGTRLSYANRQIMQIYVMQIDRYDCIFFYNTIKHSGSLF